MKIGGSKLDTAAKFFNLPVQKTPLDGQIWQAAAAGDKKAMDQIQTHCEHDVMVLRGAQRVVEVSGSYGIEGAV
jgi:hypothetical protein